MILAINYANKNFRKSQKLNLTTAIQWGADKTIAYTPNDIDELFKEKNKKILSIKKGNGVYLWKPYFLNKAYKELNEGDYLIYTDAGSIFVNCIQYLIDCMESEKLDIMVFSLQNEMIERKYTKRDAFIFLGCDEPKYTDTPQSIGGYVLVKKSNFVEKFLSEYLEYAQNEHIITEQENIKGLPNYPEFEVHRHDQSIWSLMSKKYNLKRFRDPSQFGMVNHYEAEVEMRSTFPQIIDSHRMNIGSISELKFRRSKIGKFITKVKNRIFNL